MLRVKHLATAWMRAELLLYKSLLLGGGGGGGAHNHVVIKTVQNMTIGHNQQNQDFDF